MTALFEQGFFVRKPAWHQMGTVLDHYPGREEAMRLAGHDFEIEEVKVAQIGDEIGIGGVLQNTNTILLDGRHYEAHRVPGYKALVIKQMRAPEDRDPRHGSTIGIVRESFGTVQNAVCWDIVDALVQGPNVNYETGATLDGGAQCFVTAWVDEPVEIKGDDSPIYPYLAVNWRHDGLGAIKAIRTSIREVCANTVAMAETEAERTGFEYTFRHTRNVHDRIADAKMVLAGMGDVMSAFSEIANELAELAISDAQREDFIARFIPTPPETLISERVQGNIEAARLTVRNLILSSPTVPDAHRDTGYGLLMAGTEYLDHLRGYRNTNTYVGRTLLRQEPLKAKLLPMIREVAAA
jgi:phage/plasmid-like protein (TIGR03299 family)